MQVSPEAADGGRVDSGLLCARPESKAGTRPAPGSAATNALQRRRRHKSVAPRSQPPSGRAGTTGLGLCSSERLRHTREPPALPGGFRLWPPTPPPPPCPLPQPPPGTPQPAPKFTPCLATTSTCWLRTATSLRLLWVPVKPRAWAGQGATTTYLSPQLTPDLTSLLPSSRELSR